MGIKDRLIHGWNAFMNRDPTKDFDNFGDISIYQSYRPRFSRGNEKTIVTSIYNRIALDVSAIDFVHARLDENDRYLEQIPSGLNNCLSIEANIDQTGKELIQDIVISMFDEGCVAVVPIDTTINPTISGSYDIESLRTGRIMKWNPEKVLVQVYNDRVGKRQEIWCYKRNVAIIQNPLYAVINEPNSTMKRLIRKLNLLDAIDEQSGSGKLDLIIQLPYTIKSELRRSQADKRKKDIEKQLSDSKFGVAYTDATEKITQLNRPLENNLMKQIEYLTSMLYGQLGISQSILDGTADEQTKLNYYNQTIEIIVTAITNEFRRKFITKTARTQKQTILSFRDPFKLVPVNNIAEIADKFTRNEIMTSNEFRQVIGIKPSDDPRADELRNKNLNASNQDNVYPNDMEGDEEYQYETDEL